MLITRSDSTTNLYNKTYLYSIFKYYIIYKKEHNTLLKAAYQINNSQL